MPTSVDAIKPALKRQYHASLAMLREAVERCPDHTWYDTAPKNAFWQVTYHALYFTQFYLQPDESGFVPGRSIKPTSKIRTA
jgi:hypothetical protein